MSAQTTSQRRAGADLFGQLALGKLSLCRYLASSEGYESFRSKTRGSWLLNKLVGQTMYEKRQMVLLAIAHAIATLVVWQHFFTSSLRCKRRTYRSGRTCTGGSG